MEPDQLEELRLMTNAETDSASPFAGILIGQPTLARQPCAWAPSPPWTSGSPPGMPSSRWTWLNQPHLTRLRRMIHRGVNGSYQLGTSPQTNRSYPDESPDPSLSQAQLIFQVQDGRNRVIAPQLFAAASFQAPHTGSGVGSPHAPRLFPSA
jgi:hypothetical protein